VYHILTLMSCTRLCCVRNVAYES